MISVVQVGGRARVVQVGSSDPADPVAVIVGGTRVGKLDDVADVDAPAASVPTDTPLVWRRSADGVYRLEPLDALPGSAPRWGDEVRYAASAPADPTAPDGAVWVDYATGTIYRAEES